MKSAFALSVAVVLLTFTTNDATAQQLRRALLEKVDTNSDGQVSVEEAAAARNRLFAERDERKPDRLTWSIDGVEREAIVYRPEERTDKPAPLVFGFHGHGGSSSNAARSFGFHTHWPEAVVVYMQGLPTPSRLVDPEGKRSGWQMDAGDQSDRDFRFFDEVLKTVKDKYAVDSNRIYSSGHSNGGAFTYLLWSARGDAFAAIAPSAAGARSLVTRPPAPKPVMHIAGKNDELVRFPVQELVMRRVRQINRCGDAGEAWAAECTLYASEDGAPVVEMIHQGTHQWPSQAGPLIVKFFQQHQLDEPR